MVKQGRGALTPWRPWRFCVGLIVIRRLADPDMLARDMPPNRFRDARQRGVGSNGVGSDVVVVRSRDTAGTRRLILLHAGPPSDAPLSLSAR